jgi:hypothetical protein
MRPDADEIPRVDQTADLERKLIAEFLEQRGLTMHTLQALTEAEQHKIMREASLYASMRLSEVEARWRYVDDLHQK